MHISTHESDQSDEVVGIAEIFRMLGDPNRVRILLALHTTGELCVHEIAAAVGAPQTKVSQALRLLRTAGIVAKRRDGRHIHYRVIDDHVATILSVARAHLAHDPGDASTDEVAS